MNVTAVEGKLVSPRASATSHVRPPRAVRAKGARGGHTASQRGARRRNFLLPTDMSRILRTHHHPQGVLCDPLAPPFFCMLFRLLSLARPARRVRVRGLRVRTREDRRDGFGASQPRAEGHVRPRRLALNSFARRAMRRVYAHTFLRKPGA